MLSSLVVVLVAFFYLGLLFAIAWFGDRRAKSGRSLIRSPIVYTFSLAVYCTSWTFYGAVGTAARRCLEFITIYTGPTIVFLGWWFVLRKMLRITKAYGITSIMTLNLGDFQRYSAEINAVHPSAIVAQAS